jgi:hypothetical protein
MNADWQAAGHRPKALLRFPSDERRDPWPLLPHPRFYAPTRRPAAPASRVFPLPFPPHPPILSPSRHRGRTTNELENRDGLFECGELEMSARGAGIEESRGRPYEGSRTPSATISPQPPLKRKRRVDPDVPGPCCPYECDGRRGWRARRATSDRIE